MIPNIKRLTYKDRLRHLKIPSLQHRRNRGDMITTYKIITGKFNIDNHKLFTFHHLNTRGHPFKVFKEHSKSFLKSHLFSYHIVDNWNSKLSKQSRSTYSKIYWINSSTIKNTIQHSIRKCMSLKTSQHLQASPKGCM